MNIITNAPEVKVIGALKPVDVIWGAVYGVVFEYLADASDVIAAGLISKSDLPTDRTGSYRRLPNKKVSRLADGRVRLRINADEAMKSDSGFKRMLGGILSDTRLSLVKGEAVDR